MDIGEWMQEVECDDLRAIEEELRSNKVGIFESKPMSVKDMVAFWILQLSDNPLWNVAEKSAITLTIEAIAGKNKKDALASLQTQQYKHDAMSYEACFSRMTARYLKTGM